MDYSFRQIEKKWQQQWKQAGAYTVSNATDKPKCYVLDMFPYPSGAGLHVGHPLGYIASDIYARYKRLKGFNVLHPMGFDAFGLPAEQYAIEHGIHPALSTEQNIANFKKQLDNIGFSYDWNREVRTSDPGFYKWTQWIFLQLFNSWYNRQQNKAVPIAELVRIFETSGNDEHPIPSAQFVVPGLNKRTFTAQEWKTLNEPARQTILMEYRLAYCGWGEVNWCEALGTVLANDEVVNGLSERGGYPVEKKRLRQWYLRITEYADRLLEGLDRVDFSDAMKEMQGNWIGKSYGAEIDFELTNDTGALGKQLKVYTTRPDTIFGVDFMVIAPEHELTDVMTSASQKQAVEEYIAYVKSRNERERMAEKKITGVATGAFAVHPFNGKPIPVWISEYVLAGYGTGAIMGVPCGDERDHKFAKHFGLPITNIIGDHYKGEEANPTKDAKLENSDFLNGTIMRNAIGMVIEKLEQMGIGKRKVNYKMRDAAFSRQRYWGEPFPITWENGIASTLPESELPLELPYLETYKPGPEGEGPLANVPEWTSRNLETNTMPGYAGSSWYFLRYMDPHNENEFCSRPVSDYWNQVDIYIGGTEHAVGHLLYSRMWTKALFDLGLIGYDEPYKKLVNQGMIQGSSRFVYRVDFVGIELEQEAPLFVSHKHYRKLEELADGPVNAMLDYIKQAHPSFGYRTSAEEKPEVKLSAIRVDVNFVDGVEMDIEAFRKWKPEYANAILVLEDGKYITGAEVEKMSKSKFNTVNPDVLVEKYGADTFRMYEMFLGPIEMSKPWDTKGIEGVHRFLKKLWRLFFDEQKGKQWTDQEPTADELKVLHRAIRKIEEDTERFSFNTCVSAFMVCVNELTDINCRKRAILEPILVLLTPFAPHVSEELWHQLGNTTSVLDASWPAYNAQYLVESSKEYPVSINGKMRTQISMSLELSQPEVEQIVLSNAVVQKWLEGKSPRKIIYVKNKMVNVVV